MPVVPERIYRNSDGRLTTEPGGALEFEAGQNVTNAAFIEIYGADTAKPDGASATERPALPEGPAPFKRCRCLSRAQRLAEEAKAREEEARQNRASEPASKPKAVKIDASEGGA